MTNDYVGTSSDSQRQSVLKMTLEGLESHLTSLGYCFSADVLSTGKCLRSLHSQAENVVTFPNPTSAQCFKDTLGEDKEMAQVAKGSPI